MPTQSTLAPYCGLCDGDHAPHQCPAVDVMQRTEDDR